jgi:uroporphyrinogen decarboxylase
MDAASLVAACQKRIAFLGGIDTQDLLVHGTPADIAREVHRLKQVFGPRWIISPSHEAILPDIPPANIEALASAARGA